MSFSRKPQVFRADLGGQSFVLFLSSKSRIWHVMKAVISAVEEIKMKGELPSFQLRNNDSGVCGVGEEEEEVGPWWS